MTSDNPDGKLGEVTTSPDLEEASSDTVDLMLANLVVSGQLTDSFSIGVTLTVRGAVVTGTLVGRNTWLHHLRESFDENFKALGDIWVEDFSYDGEADPERLARDQFIHLIDAHVMSGGTALPSFEHAGSHWRGLLASVDGWSVGRYGPSTPTG